MPLATTAAFQATGSLAYALIYPIAVPAVCFILSLFLMPETRHILASQIHGSLLRFMPGVACKPSFAGGVRLRCSRALLSRPMRAARA